MRAWLETLVPEGLDPAQTDDARRARLLIALTLLLGLIQVLGACVSTLVRGPNPLAVIILAGAVGVFSTLPLFRRTASVPLAASWVLGVVFVNVSATAWLGYGFQSPALHVYMLFPVLGMALGGFRVGVGLGAATVVQLVIVYTATRAGFPFPLKIGGPGYLLFHFLVQTSMLVVLTAILSVYEGAWQVAREESVAARLEVERANRAKSAFLSNMSHELRTPLNAVIGYVEMLAEDARDDQVDDLDRVGDAAHHLLSLVNDVLDLARVESERIDLEITRFELAPIVQQTIEEIRPMLGDKPIVTHVQVPDGAAVSGDYRRVHQVLLNLLSNAAKFTDSGTIRIDVSSSQTVVHVRVSDTGPGMAPNEVLSCFDPFEQGEVGRGQGTGLGLAISQRLCEAMHGELVVESQQGRGTTFTMSLPI